VVGDRCRFVWGKQHEKKPGEMARPEWGSAGGRGS
jgi:hypothetical protein